MPATATSSHIPDPKKRKPEGFPKGTPVVTDRGIVFIEDVRQGDQVVDHNGKWAKVTKSHKHKGPTARISGDGHPPIEASDSHPVLVRQKDGSPAWVAPRLLDPKIHEWATPTHFDPLPIPAGAPDSPEEWHLVGSYLRSGSISGDTITLRAANRREAQGIRQHLAGWTGRENKSGGVTFEGRDQAQAKWLAEHFGDKAHTKTVPPWALGMDEDHRRALLRGYYGPDWEPLPTPSPFLVTGARLVAETLGERTNITPVWSSFRPKYQAERLDSGHGGSGNHSWLRNQRGEKTGRVRELFELEVGEGGGGSFVAGTGGKVVSACGEKPEPKPSARSRATAKPPAAAAQNGGGGGGSNGRQSPASKPRRIPSVASIADALGHSVPAIGWRKPRTPQRDTAGVVRLTPAQEQRVQRGIRSLDGVQREEAVADVAAVPQSARARKAARVAEDRLNQRGVSVAELASMREIDALNKDIPGTAASSKAKHQGLVRQDVHDVLAAERPAREQRVINDFSNATTINQLGKITADWLGGAEHLNHPGGYDKPADETAQIRDPLIQLNQAGYATYGSQPGHAPETGWDGRTYEQRAAVDGFADRATADRIQDLAEGEGLTVIRHSGAGRRTDYSKDVDTTYADGKPITSFGQRLSRSYLKLAMDGHMTDELSRAEQVTVVDPGIGRNDRLERFAQRMDEQRRSDPINDAWMVDDLNGLPPGSTENDIRRERGEVVPDLRDELRTPAERQEREARMVAAEQTYAPDRTTAATAERPAIADTPHTLPLNTPVHDAVGRNGFDGFAASAERRGITATPEHAAQPVVTRVDGRPVTAEIVDMAGAVGNGHAGLPTAERARLEASSQEPDLLQQISEASALREMQTVPVGREQSGRLRDAAPMWEQQSGPNGVRQSVPNPLTDTSWLQDGTASNHEPTAAPEGWSDAYATQARVAAEARDRGLPVDREAFERHLDEAWTRLVGQGARTTPPERERGLRQAGEGDLPEPVYGQDRTVEQDGTPPEFRRGLARAGERGLPELAPIDAGREAEDVVPPELRRGLARPEDAELPPPPKVDDAQPAERPPHDPDVLERHGLADLAEKRAAGRPDEPPRPEDPISKDTQSAERTQPEPDTEPEAVTVDRTAELAETRDLAPDHSQLPTPDVIDNSRGME